MRRLTNIKGIKAMGKKVFLIAVVICLDLAFILMMRDDNGADRSRSIEPPAARQPIPITDQPEQPISDDRVAADEDQPRTARLSRSVSDKVPRKAYASQKVQNRPAEDRAPEKFTDTIIWYERASYVHDDEPDRVAVTAAKTTRNNDNASQKKRSFFDRALPVVKKPYRWVKTLVTKL